MEYKDTYRRDLPHIVPKGGTYFVTFRLADSLPASALARLKSQREGEDGVRFSDYDKLLDAASDGLFWLNQPEIARIVMDAFMEIEDQLICITIMPNHVHVVLIVKLEHSLIEILQKIKGSTSRYCNLALKRSGKFWQHESYDHSIRSNEFERIVAYVLNNPVKACLVKEWKDWPWTYLNPKWREL